MAAAEEWGSMRSRALCGRAGYEYSSSNYDGTYMGAVSCTSSRQRALAVLIGFIPGAILGVLGFSIGWIFSGFRRRP
jgi:hypothetical protein